VFQNHRRNFVITAANGISGPKIEKSRSAGATGRRIEGRRLLVLEKEAVSANQVRDHYDQGWVHTQLKRSVTNRAATTVDALVSTMQNVGLTKGKCKNAKYMKEMSRQRKG
jgi:hypothetical protein